MNRKTLLALTVLLLLSLLLPACASTPSSVSDATVAQTTVADPGTTSADQSQTASEDPIWVALVYPMTGDNAQFGEIEVRAHKFVIDQINAEGGINGRKIEYEVFDDQGDPQQAATIAQKIVGDSRFVAGFGHYRSVCTLAAIPIYDEAGFLFLTDSINEKITGISPYVFRYSITDAEAGKQLVWAAVKNHPEYQSAAIIYTQSDFGVGLNDVIAPELESLGVPVVDTESYFEGQSRDYTPQLTKIKSANADVIFILGYYSEAALIVQQAHQLGMDVDFWGPDGMNNQGLIDLGGEDVESNVYSTAYFSSQLDYPGVAETVAAFKTDTGVDLDGFSAISLDATRLLFAGIEEVGTDKTALHEWLTTQTDFVGVSGPIVFDANNDNERQIVVLHVENGVFVPAEEQVPDEYFASK